jgi:undecaprenyl pyrophosphate synthase
MCNEDGNLRSTTCNSTHTIYTKYNRKKYAQHSKIISVTKTRWAKTKGKDISEFADHGGSAV